MRSVFQRLAGWRCLRTFALIAVVSLVTSGCSAPRPAFGRLEPAPRSDGRLPGGVVPQHYQVALDIDPRKESFSGRASITVRVQPGTAALVLHAASLRIRSVHLMRGDRRVAAWHRSRLAVGSQGDPGELVIVPQQPLEPGEQTVIVDYDASFSMPGLVNATHEGRRYTYTVLEPQGARHVFPCIDDPALRATFTLLITAPEHEVVATSMPLVSTRRDGQGRIEHRFATTPPLPTYLLGFAVGPYEMGREPQQDLGTPLRVFVPRGELGKSGDILGITRDAIKELAAYFGEPAPIAKLDVLAAPGFLRGGGAAMEYPGLFMVDSQVMLNPRETPTNLMWLMSHEVSHLWMGVQVGIPWWSDVWLKEGLAEFLAYKAAPRRKWVFRTHKQQLMWGEGVACSPAVRRDTTSGHGVYDAFTYVKAASVMDMLEGWMGAEAMQRALRTFVRNHRWKIARADDLIRALRAESRGNVAPVLHTFLNQPGVPLVEAEVSCDTSVGAARVSLKQRAHRHRHDPNCPADARWYLPVCVRYGAGDETGRVCALVPGGAAELELPARRCPDWMHPNADDRGYYVWKLPEAELLALVRHLGSLSPAEQDNLWFTLHVLKASGDLEHSAHERLVTAMRSAYQPRVNWKVR
jgi:alanyl aminopeptidase